MRTSLSMRILSSAVAVPLVLAGCAKAESTDPSSSNSIGSAAQDGDDGEFCEVLLSDTQTSATVFTVPLPAGSGVDQGNIAARIALLEKITTTPDGLADDLETWRDYLEAVAQTTSLAEAFTVKTDETESAGDALFEEYIGNCL